MDKDSRETKLFAPDGGIFINPPPPFRAFYCHTERKKTKRKEKKGGGVCPTAK
jgi:hypothetical protein